jgi:hypothetical protein
LAFFQSAASTSVEIQGRSIVEVGKEREFRGKKGQNKEGWRFLSCLPLFPFLRCLPKSPTHANALVCRDGTLGEDACRIRKVMAALRNSVRYVLKDVVAPSLAAAVRKVTHGLDLAFHLLGLPQLE